LSDATLRLGSTRGISNEMLESTADVRIERGSLLVIVEQPAG
jgi:thiamine pyrophosphokinase